MWGVLLDRMDPTRLRRCLEPGLSILVGTADSAGTPSCCRGIAIQSLDEFETITVFLPVATSHETIHNVATTKQLAVVATHPRDNFATQFKGTTLDARLAREDESAFVRQRLDALADVLDRIGVPRRLTHRVAHWPAFALTMRVEQVFDQTPGPKAGSRVR
jgi:predicted RNA-binding Zn ribbon-like protein